MLQKTYNWYNGEIFEGTFILAFGVVTIISALLFYFYGNSPSPKALLIPFLVLGLFFSATGVNMMYANTKKTVQAGQLYAQDQKAFINAEIKRVEDFQYLYPMSIAVSGISFLIAVALLAWTQNVRLQAIAITLIVLGSAFAMIDYFSKERAAIYYAALKSAQNNSPHAAR